MKTLVKKCILALGLLVLFHADLSYANCTLQHEHCAYQHRLVWNYYSCMQSRNCLSDSGKVDYCRSLWGSPDPDCLSRMGVGSRSRPAGQIPQAGQGKD